MQLQRKKIFKFTPLGIALLLAILLVITASAEPVTETHTYSNVDWTSAGVGGVGGGSGTITVSGVTGTVSDAFLFWHGIDISGTGAVYDNATVSINGNSVTGVSLGDSSTNCWGDGSSRAYRADVSQYVTGDGAYTITGMSALPGHDANGASLIVIFDDGNDTNNRDIVFFEGNDSDVPQGYPGDPIGWDATLADINYQGGSAYAQLHVSDGQSFGDDSLTFSTAGGSVTIPDTAGGRFDGDTLPSAGTSRTTNGDLWDIHTFDITGAFGPAGVQTVSMSGQTSTSDCHGLVVLLIDLEPGSAPGPTPTPAPTAVPVLPDTGFAPNRTTVLAPPQKGFEYTEMDGISMSIPSLDLKSTVVGVPAGDGGWDVSWLWRQVGHLENTAYPTWPGNTVLTGHVTLPNGLPGPFADLKELRWGDQIVIKSYGQEYVYEVRETKYAQPNSRSALKHEDKDWLTLITCSHYNEALDSYRWRYIVRSVLVDVK